MKLLLLVAVIITASEGLCTSRLLEEEWETFKVQYNKTYSNPVEEKFRMKIYLENRRQIAKHNRAGKTFKLAINKYADMLSRELSARMNGFRQDVRNNTDRQSAATFIPPKNVVVPDAVDWNQDGAVTDVKDQGQCGSCWSFAATGALEGQHFRKTSELISVSEQNLIDCATGAKYYCNGCNGGSMNGAFRYVQDNHGIDTETSYPYKAEDDVCRYSENNKGADDVGYSVIPAGDEDNLKIAVATVGPVAVGIDASKSSFQSYSSGVYYEPDCSSSSLNHGVLVVGYGTEEGQDYWLVKNSWGKGWGDEGYIKMARNKYNNCGIATMASYPLV